MIDQQLNVDLAVTDEGVIVFYVEAPAKPRVTGVEFHADGGVVLIFEGEAKGLTLEAPVATELQAAFKKTPEAAIGHITNDGTLLAEYMAPIMLRRARVSR